MPSAEFSITTLDPSLPRRLLGLERADGTWEAWIEFRSAGGVDDRVTDRETTQPNRAAVEYWARGLEPVYFEGAFVRSVPVSTGDPRARRGQRD